MISMEVISERLMDFWIFVGIPPEIYLHCVIVVAGWILLKKVFALNGHNLKLGDLFERDC